MPSNEFNEWVDRVADGLKQAVGPFGGLLNPQSSQATQKKIAELEAEVARKNKLLDIQIDNVNDRTNELRAVKLERDALRAQLDALTSPGRHEAKDEKK